MSGVIIRALEPSEWEAFREFRLTSLKASPGVFSFSYDQATAQSPQDWRTAIKGDDHQVFGIFDDERLVGVTGAFSYEGDPTGQTAVLVMSFILPSHRRRGLSRMLYEARLAWILAHPKFRRVLVAHRKSNEASRRANQRHGFRLTHTVSHVWPDGETGDEVFYELELRNDRHENEEARQ